VTDLVYKTITLTERITSRHAGHWEYAQDRFQILVVQVGNEFRALARATTTMPDARTRFGAGAHRNSGQAITAAFAEFVGGRADEVRARPPRRVTQVVRDAELDAMIAAARQLAELNP